ncbi:tripartite ATP-independent periplasmic transporter solute receptor, DctP family [Desulfosporosinus orientis DSM 765]|uniref:Tripartite ATP-independent periplasmic transporter solute receptor, DctP family n=1 Tax=Desulfosporosinus orientis (strain ATCC 19365 / DSM 765 / NCIMB 8382 / VKM B-1628 / Singapore I) TaxID=768706 RepID=G7WIZ1_DESOD|nr:TRAP transporter substrate-binding protein [Desulfosporosinus orientis]AET69716.1 tripartite ATP-independent periplasmic transporter solute receptor, DctP family [Desulfosporosinus orientis DSM 765]
MFSKRKKGISWLLLGVLVLMLGVTGCGGEKPAASTGSDQTITIKVGHVLAPDHPYTIGLKKFGELVEQKTQGKVKVEVFHSSQLGNERDMIEALQLGTQQMALVSTAPLASFTKEFLVFDLPFIFNDSQSAHKVLDGEIGQGILNSLESQGIIGLSYWENGFRHVTNNTRPINKPEDLKGLKIRLMENPIHMDTFRTMGADPTPMAFGELFTALQQGTIDGQENPIPIIWTSKFYEVQKQLSLTGHFYAAAPLLVSKTFFDGLAPEYQNAIKEASIEARDYERDLIAQQETEFLGKLKDQGVNVIEVDKSLFKEAVKPVYSKYEGEIGKDLIDKVISAQQ